jgi:predicted PurR-regulated permease PerM
MSTPIAMARLDTNCRRELLRPAKGKEGSGTNLGRVRAMARTAGASAASPVAIWILVALATIWFLRAARAVLIPIALAVLISYALEPAVAWLERRHIHRTLASTIVLLVVVGAAAAGIYSLKDDAARLAESLPQAVERARDLVTSQLGSSAEALDKATAAMAGKSEEGRQSKPGGTSNQVTGSVLERAVSAILALAGHLVVIVFLVLFLLISGHHVRNRLVEIIGSDSDDRRTTATIIDEINEHLQRYLLVLLFTGAVVGVSTWLVLLWIGAQHAAMWGVLAGVFNSVPYFGPVIVSGGLFVIGVVQGGGLTQALQMSGAAVIITSLEGWLLTPPLMGKVERMSSLAVFIGLLLWTWVWGAWGTVLAVPMLVIVKSTADHVPRLRPLGRLMAP